MACYSTDFRTETTSKAIQKVYLAIGVSAILVEGTALNRHPECPKSFYLSNQANFNVLIVHELGVVVLSLEPSCESLPGARNMLIT